MKHIFLIGATLAVVISAEMFAERPLNTDFLKMFEVCRNTVTNKIITQYREINGKVQIECEVPLSKLEKL